MERASLFKTGSPWIAFFTASSTFSYSTEIKGCLFNIDLFRPSCRLGNNYLSRRLSQLCQEALQYDSIRQVEIYLFRLLLVLSLFSQDVMGPDPSEDDGIFSHLEGKSIFLGNKALPPVFCSSDFFDPQ